MDRTLGQADCGAAGGNHPFTIWFHHLRMQETQLSNGPEALLALDAQRAGLALACAFSSSDEFEAAVIRARREAGAFGPARGRRRRAVYWGCALGALILLLIVSL